MTCQVTIRAADASQKSVAVPLTAIYAPAQGGEYVWVVKDGRVEQRAVELGDIFGRDMVSVRRGLSDGEEVVVAGVYRLQEGERVRIINE